MGIKASHNTMTYREPLQWWLRPLAWVARCQDKHHTKQDAKAWDLRVFWDKEGNVQFRHGMFAYYGEDIYSILFYANYYKISVRIMLENRSYLNRTVEMRNMRHKFRELCESIDRCMPGIKAFGGRDLYTWEEIYHFDYQPKTADLYSSQDGKQWYKKLNDLCPWLWSKLHNKKMLKKLDEYPDDVVVLYDFV